MYNFYMTDKTLLLGKAAEYLFISHLLMNGIECYVPVGEASRIDVLTGSSLKRCQVKMIYKSKTQSGLWIRKAGGQKGKTYTYSSLDVDFMIGADLDSMSVYIVPIEDIARYKAIMGLKALERGRYMNNFSLLTQ